MFDPWNSWNDALLNTAVHPASVKGSNPRGVSSNSSLLKMNAGRKKGPICRTSFPIAESSDPFFADFQLANACPFGLNVTLVNTCACSCLTSICDAPEFTGMVALLCVS